MIKNFLRLFYPGLVIFAFINLSCKEDYNPQGNFKPAYIINCIVSSGGTVATAYVGKVYMTDGHLPSVIDSSGFIRDAYIRITNFQNIKELFVFKNNKYYSTPPPPDPRETFIPNTEAELYARMPDGTELTSKITLPKPCYYEINRTFNQGLTTTGEEWKFGRTLEFNWESTYSPDYLYFTKMLINAEVISTQKYLSIEVPLKYEKQGDKYIPIYPQGIRDPKVGYDYAAIDSAMKNISAGYEDKSDIRVLNWMFRVTNYERNLSSFYTSSSGIDNFTIRLDQNTFSNIIGGYGVFGSYCPGYGESHPVHKDYCKSFGYRSIYGD